MSACNVGLFGYGWAASAHIAAINATRQGRVMAVGSARPLDAADPRVPRPRRDARRPGHFRLRFYAAC